MCARLYHHILLLLLIIIALPLVCFSLRYNNNSTPTSDTITTISTRTPGTMLIVIVIGTIKETHLSTVHESACICVLT